MAKIIIKECGRLLDGEYDLDVGTFTNRELHTIKKVAGVRVGEFEDAMLALDNDLVLAFALIALRRSGKTVSDEMLWDFNAGAITLDLSDEEEPVEDDALPPAAEPPAQPNASGNESSSETRTDSSGSGLRSVSAVPPETNPPSTGRPDLATGAGSA